MHRIESLADASRVPFWLDDPTAPTPCSPLVGRTAADLVVVGGGYTGLWTAFLAKQRAPAREVVLVEADRCGWAASGRNGGFVAASLTHGWSNGARRFPGEIDHLDRLGRENLDEIEATIARLGIDCHFERTGELSVATEPHEVDQLEQQAAQGEEGGRFLDRDEVRAEVHSPRFLAGYWDTTGVALVNPARLAFGLRQACLDAGVRLFEHTPVDTVEEEGGRVRVRTAHGTVEAATAALGTNGFPSPVRRVRRYVVPVYDYVLMTEPLTPAQLDEIGWRNRQGLGEVGNLFCYFRLSADNRILFGGYDAVYHYGNRVRPRLEERPRTFAHLLARFDATFPQLDRVAFTHAWAGVIDTCSRYCVFFDRSASGRVVSALGYTGLGVGASRFGAKVMLELLDGGESPLTGLELVRRKPIPFPPEPIRFVGIQATRRSLAQADRRGGHRNLWLRALDRVGMGFDS